MNRTFEQWVILISCVATDLVEACEMLDEIAWLDFSKEQYDELSLIAFQIHG